MSGDGVSGDPPGGAGDRCELCGRDGVALTRHHLIPRTRHRNQRNRKTFSRDEVRDRIALLCRPCHGNVHVSIDNKSLESEWNTLEALRTHPDVARFTEWIRDKPARLKVAFPRRGRRR